MEFGVIWVFPKIRLNKFVKLVKNFNQWPNFDESWTQDYKSDALQDGPLNFLCELCLKHDQFHVLPCLTHFIKLS